MRQPKLLILALFLIMCGEKEITFNNFFSRIKGYQLDKKYLGISNVYRRNNIFNFEKDSLKISYKVNHDGIEILDSSGVIDTASIISELEKIILDQKTLGIIGFASENDEFKIYFDVKNIVALPLNLVDGENQGVLIKSNYPLSITRIENDWYFEFITTVSNPPNYNP